MQPSRDRGTHAELRRILAGLTAIAHRGVPVAIGWHVVLAVALLAVARGWRPSRRLPMASVASFAFGFGNPFNGTMFAAASVALVALAATGPIAR